MKRIINNVITSLNNPSQEVRSLISAVYFDLLVYALSVYIFKEGLFDSYMNAVIGLMLPLGYLLFLGLYYLFIVSFSKRYKVLRIYLLYIFHIIFLTAGIVNANEYGIIVVPLYLWIIMASGIRFGASYLYVSLASTIVAVAGLSVLHPYWQTQLTVNIAILVSIILIPLSYINIVKSIHKANAALRDNLKEMKKRARYDYLTGLANRSFLQSKLLKKISNSKVHSGDFSLVFIDLDGFKAVNDTLGHHIGDEVLTEVASRIKHLCEPHHFAARLGGDEFVIIFNQNHNIDLFLQALLVEISRTYAHDITGISASIGVSEYNENYENDEEYAYQIKKEADTAMYEAKKLGKNQYVYFNKATQSGT